MERGRSPVALISLCLLFILFAPARRTAASDCNRNDILDEEDIQSGLSWDCNLNGVPDECDIAPTFQFEGVAKVGLDSPANHVLAADLDRDGDLDLVCTNGSWAMVAILTNRGTGAFAAPIVVVVPDIMGRTYVDDFNADGYTDILVATYPQGGIGGNCLVLLAQTSLRQFKVSSAQCLDVQFDDLASGDFDGDGDPDLVVSTLGSSVTTLMWNDGKGRFADPGVLLDASFPGVALPVDIDLDGDLDLVSSTADWQCYILENRGAGASWAHVKWACPSGTVMVGDVDGDGDPDLVSLGQFAPLTVAVILNDGKGKFSLGPSATYSAIRRGISNLGDFDGDGDADLTVVPVESGAMFWFYENTGAGAFLERGSRTLGLHASFVADGDLDGDGRVDLAAVGSWDDRTTLLFGSPMGPRAPQALPLGSFGESVHASDFDGDGILDLCAGESGGVEICRGRGDGSFHAPESFGNEAGMSVVTTVFNFDSDGAPDLAQGTINPCSIVVFANSGEGRFEVRFRLLDTPSSLASIFGGDADGDGDDDLFLGSSMGFYFVRNDGGSLASPVSLLPDQVSAVEGGDLDGDGDLDLAIASWGGYAACLLRQADGSYVRHAYPCDSSAYALSAADLDSDGDLDLAVAEAAEIRLLENLGEGEFALVARVPSLDNACTIEVADMDQRGGPDLVLVSGSHSEFAVHLRTSNWTYAAPVLAFGGSGPEDGTLADFDADGLTDVAVVNGSTQLLLVIRNGSGARSPDADHDGIPDDCVDLRFHRGDPNASGRFDIVDATFLLSWLFLGTDGPPCDDAADTDDDGSISVTDPIVILSYLFLGSAVPAAPFGACGVDPTPDELSCKTFPACAGVGP